MAHLTVRSSYRDLVERLNKFPQGAPPSELLFRILKMLFTEREAQLAALLPLKPFSALDAATCWKLSESESTRILDGLADKGIILDIARNGRMEYILPPPMAGFFEFSLMRVRTDVDQKALSELLHQYLDEEDDFIKALFGVGETQMGRIFVQERALPDEATVKSSGTSLHVLDYERASRVVATASKIGVGLCYCRHKAQHLGKNCDAPMEICLSFNRAAESLVRHEVCREIDAAQCMDILQEAQEQGLVQFGENARRGVSFICNCCGCCCEALKAVRRLGFLNPVHTTNFLPEIDTRDCRGCGKCVSACPVEALGLVSANDRIKKKKKKVVFTEEKCLGCAVCVRACPHDHIKLRQRPERVITPVSSVHRTVLMAIERGKLQNLIFDKQAFSSHRAMAAILGVILRLPPVKKALAKQQLNSRYVEKLLG